MEPVVVVCLLGVAALIGSIIAMVAWIEEGVPLIIVGLVPIAIFILFLGPSSMFVEYAKDDSFVVAKDTPDKIHGGGIWCYNGCANIYDEVNYSSVVWCKNSMGVAYEFVVVPDEKMFPYFVASLPFNNSNPLEVDEVKKVLDDMIVPLVIEFNQNVMQVDFSSKPDLVSPILQLNRQQVIEAQFTGELYGFMQSRLKVIGWRIDGLVEVRAVEQDVNGKYHGVRRLESE